jgi:predicted Rossmann-fold nucleotide-binding protein
MSINNLPIIGVVCSHSKEDESNQERAREVGKLVASLDAHLLTGGGQGLMSVVAQAFVDYPGPRNGLSIGVIPSKDLGTIRAS